MERDETATVEIAPPLTARPRGRLHHRSAAAVLAVGFAAVIGIMLAVIIVGLVHMAELSQYLRHVVIEHNSHAELITQMHNAARERAMLLQSMVITTDPFDREEQFTGMHQLAERYQRAYRELLSRDLSTQEKKLLEAVIAQVKTTAPLQRRVMELLADERFDEATRVLLEGAVPAQNRAVRLMERFTLMQQGQNRNLLDLAARNFHHGATMMSGLGAGVVILSMFMARFVRVRIDAMLEALQQARARSEVANEELEQHVLARTAELEEVNASLKAEIAEREEADRRLKESATQLRQKTLRLQRVNAELQKFAHVASHDLKAPLRAVSYLTNAIEEELSTGRPEEACGLLRILRSRVQRMDRLIDALLEYAEVGRSVSPLVLVDTGPLLDAIAASANDRFRIVRQPVMPCLMADVEQLDRVFRQLIDNAVRHHGRSEGTIHVAAKDIGDIYEFSVSDDGRGILPEHQPKIFEMFQTLQRRDETEYTGMGLATVKKIVEHNGGAIRVESRKRGATFFFTWPKEPGKETALRLGDQAAGAPPLEGNRVLPRLSM